MTIQTRSTPSLSAIPPTLLCPLAPGPTSAPFTPPFSFAFLAWRPGRLHPNTPPATSSTTGSPPSIRQGTCACEALPNVALASATAAQMELRRQTGGFSLLSAKEVQPGVLVFRLRDETPSATEALGTLQVRPNSSPATIASFSLRAVPSPRHDSPRDRSSLAW